MGLLFCLGTFSIAFSSLFALVAAISVYANASDFGDPEGVLRHEVSEFGVIVAIAVLSALVGARCHQRWLAAHRTSAARAGAIAGSMSAAVLLVLAGVWLSAPRPIAATALLVGRFAFLLGPGVVTHLVLRANRRDEMRDDVPED